MKRYFFHLNHLTDVIVDKEGQHSADLDGEEIKSNSATDPRSDDREDTDDDGRFSTWGWLSFGSEAVSPPDGKNLG